MAVRQESPRHVQDRDPETARSGGLGSGATKRENQGKVLRQSETRSERQREEETRCMCVAVSSEGTAALLFSRSMRWVKSLER